MLTITTKQARQRYKTLPEELQNAIFSSDTADIIRKIAENHHLSDQKTSELGGAAGLVLLGFIHKDDAWKQIQDAALVGPEVAKDLAKALDRDLFLKYASALEGSYNPNIPPEEPFSSARPTLDSILPKTAPAVAGPSSAPRSLESIAASSSAQKISITAPAPTPVTKPSMGASAIPAGAPAPAPMPPLGQPQTQKISPLAPKPTSPSPTPATSQKPTPAPFMIHAESTPPPIVQAPKFKFEASTSSGSAFGSAGRGPSIAPPPKPAQVEIGREEKLKPIEPISKIVSAPRVIHYSSLSSPINIQGGPTAGATATPSSFGSLSPMPARPESAPSPAPLKPASAPIPSSPTSIPVKNPLVSAPTPAQTNPPSFGGVIKGMVSPTAIAEPKKDIPPPPAPLK